jgi:hypothetical protein
MLYVGYFIFICVYFALPWYLQILLLVLNTIFPDPVPYIDEFFMYLGLFRKLKLGYTIYKLRYVVAVLVGILLVIGAVYGVKNYILA